MNISGMACANLLRTGRIIFQKITGTGCGQQLDLENQGGGQYKDVAVDIGREHIMLS